MASPQSPPRTTAEFALVTGANSGIGLEACKQLVQRGVKRVVLACRNMDKANAAVDSLVEATKLPKESFQVIQLDTLSLQSCVAAATAAPSGLDAVLLNAGGFPGSEDAFQVCTDSGAARIFQQNTIGHAAMVDALVGAGKLRQGARIVWVGSEGARGMPGPTGGVPQFETPDASCIASYIDGSAKKWHGQKLFQAYAYAKLVMALYVGALARQHPEHVHICASPGHTSGTNVANEVPGFTGAMMRNVMFPVMKGLGKINSVEVGTKRLVDSLVDANIGPSGAFWASPKDKLIGKFCNQAEIYPIFADQALQDQAFEAVRRFTAKATVVQ